MPKPEFVLVPREPTEEQLDELCVAMWRNFLHWRLADSSMHPSHKMLQSKRKLDRTRMRSFLAAIPPAPSVDEEMLEALKAADEHLAEYIREVGGLIVPAKSMRLLDKIRAAITRATGGKE